MILRELFEAKAKSVGIIFGRFNPPHMGHMKAWEMASENSTWYVGTNKSTQGPKDPLPFDIKVKAMEAVYPEIKGHIVAEQSWLTLASKVYEKHGNVVLNVYTDEAWVTKALVQYNGKEGAHGYYEFGTIQQQETPRLSSATSLRNAVAADDRDLFGQAAGVDPNTLVAGHPFFDVVKHYLMPHAEKAAAKPVKKKVKEPVAELSSELLGRYKKAAGADASAADKAGNYDRGNKRFSGIVKATKKQFSNDAKGVEEALPTGEESVQRQKLIKYIARQKDWDSSDLEHATTRELIQLYKECQKERKDWNDRRSDWWNRADTLSKEKGISKLDALDQTPHDLDRDSKQGQLKFKEQGVSENAWDRLQREKALESAGVGIITKQNSTVDVNKNTPKKNLKAFRLI